MQILLFIYFSTSSMIPPSNLNYQRPIQNTLNIQRDTIGSITEMLKKNSYHNKSLNNLLKDIKVPAKFYTVEVIRGTNYDSSTVVGINLFFTKCLEITGKEDLVKYKENPNYFDIYIRFKHRFSISKPLKSSIGCLVWDKENQILFGNKIISDVALNAIIRGRTS